MFKKMFRFRTNLPYAETQVMDVRQLESNAETLFKNN